MTTATDQPILANWNCGTGVANVTGPVLAVSRDDIGQPFDREGWECRIFPSPTNAFKVTFCAKKGARATKNLRGIRLEMTTDSADTFNPEAYYGR